MNGSNLGKHLKGKTDVFNSANSQQTTANQNTVNCHLLTAN